MPIAKAFKTIFSNVQDQLRIAQIPPQNMHSEKVYDITAAVIQYLWFDGPDKKDMVFYPFFFLLLIEEGLFDLTFALKNLGKGFLFLNDPSP